MKNSTTGSDMTFEAIIDQAYYTYRGYWDEFGDKRTIRRTLLDGGPWVMFSLVLSYLYFVKIGGPKLMANRKPFHLMWPIRIYNAFMVVFNTYLFINFGRKLAFGLNCWGCGVAVQILDDETLRVAQLVLLSRYFDFFDSIFFVLRKKYTHLSLLHVVHHASVPIIFWFAIKFSLMPIIVFAGFINLPIHMIMYSYYALSTFPLLRQHLWWKKYITTLQIVQFLIDLVHASQPLYITCKYPTLTYVQGFVSIGFIILFGNFYTANYTANRKTSGSEKSDTAKACSQDNKFKISEGDPNTIVDSRVFGETTLTKRKTLTVSLP